jgi:DNA-directed RNA polymerase specialized sigma subunit
MLSLSGNEETDSKKDVSELWDDFFADPSVENKNELLMHYLYLVKRIVLRMMPIYKNQNDYDDLLSNGVIGLMDAISKFDMMRNVNLRRTPARGYRARYWIICAARTGYPAACVPG